MRCNIDANDRNYKSITKDYDRNLRNEVYVCQFKSINDQRADWGEWFTKDGSKHVSKKNSSKYLNEGEIS